MTVPGSTNPLLAYKSSAAAYTVSRSLRFNSADSAYLSRTPASAGNRKTWTWSGWVKRSAIGLGLANYALFGVASNFFVRFTDDDGGDCIRIYNLSPACNLITSYKFKDPSAWYHIVIALDTTQATNTNRLKYYVNGVQYTSFSTSSYPVQNADLGWNSTTIHGIGSQAGSVASEPFSGYLTEIHFIDGQALTPSSFAETNATTGLWVPKLYSGTYGTNGFKLTFSDNSSTTAATLGADTSGNGNNWTPNNFSVTAGAGNDSLRDTPTSGGTDTGVGGEVRGNYCTWNPLKFTFTRTFTNGNLDLSVSSSQNLPTLGTIGVKSGKWYWEITPTTVVASRFVIGVADQSWIGSDLGDTQYSYGYINDARKYNNGSASAYGATYVANDVIGVALDMDAGTLTFYKNGVSQGQAFSGITQEMFPAVGSTGASGAEACTANFGQRAFAYTAPSGFSPLVDTLLPTPTIAKPNTVMDVKLYTGNASTQTISGLAFSPDLVWTKSRANAYSHLLYDTVRGATKYLTSNNADAEGTGATTLTAFNSDGFTLGSGENSNQFAGSVAWTWDAGSSNATNTSGTITSTVRANISAGFSIVTYTGSNVNGTVGHGLGVKPSLLIFKDRNNNSTSWLIYHSSLGATQYLDFTTAAATTSSNAFANTEPTSTVFTAGNFLDNATNYVCYAWTPVAGLSSFGSYVGNGSSDGPFVYTGFRPRWVMVKKTNSASISDWVIQDAGRDTYNPSIYRLYSNLSNAEDSGSSIDFLSNGFKIRVPSAYANINETSSTYIYAAFAEAPFPYSRAR